MNPCRHTFHAGLNILNLALTLAITHSSLTVRSVLVLGNELVVSGSWDGTVRAWSLARGNAIQVMHVFWCFERQRL